MNETRGTASAGDASKARKNLVESEMDSLVRSFEDFADPSQVWRRRGGGSRVRADSFRTPSSVPPLRDVW
jgi:hypothetical protein